MAIFLATRPKKGYGNIYNNIFSETSTKEIEPENRTPITLPTMAEEQVNNNPMADSAFTALKAYICAYNDNQPQNVLDELNKDCSHELGVTVQRNISNGKLTVYDLDENEVLVYNG